MLLNIFSGEKDNTQEVIQIEKKRKREELTKLKQNKALRKNNGDRFDRKTFSRDGEKSKFDKDGYKNTQNQTQSNENGNNEGENEEKQHKTPKKNKKPAKSTTSNTPFNKKDKKPEEALPTVNVQKKAGHLDSATMKKVGKNSSNVLAKTGFAALNIDPNLAKHLEEVGYGIPTRIQEASIPVLCKRRDTLIKSETGSGKTLAYLLPVINDLLFRPERITREYGTIALIIAPTRELAIQIENVFKVVTKPFHWLIATTLMGGENKKAEKARLRKGVHIVIGTPGRIKDHMESTAAWVLDKIRWFILDEADRLLDLGFDESMKSIYRFVDVVANSERDIRCNVLVSATLNKGDGVDTLAEVILRDPLYVGFNKDDEDNKKSVSEDGLEKKTEKKTDGEDKAKGEENDDSSDDDSDSEDEAIKRAIINNTTGVVSTSKSSTNADTFVTPTTLKQLYSKMSSRHRLVALASFLRLRVASSVNSEAKCKIVVFVSTCAVVEFLHKVFSHTFWPDNESGLKTVVEGDEASNPDAAATKAAIADIQRDPLLNTQLWKLHGNMPQKQRTSAYFEFCKASEGILFCTDVAARGLDMPAVDWIIQYDAPEDTDDYVHRVGRTARIGHAGQAIIFLVESELGYLDLLKNKGIALELMPLERLLGGLHYGIDKTKIKPVMGPNGRPLPAGAILQKQLENMIKVSPSLANLAREAYISFFRSYAAYPKDLRHIFHPKRLHFGEVAHSFALTEKPTDIGKKATEIHEETIATIAPIQAAKLQEEKFKNKPKSLNQLAKASGKKGDLQEFM